MGGYVLGFSDIGLGQVMRPSENGTEPSRSIKFTKFVKLLNNYQFLKRDTQTKTNNSPH
jgi:hypothetical protein